MSDSTNLQFSPPSHPHTLPKFRGGTDPGTRKMEDCTLSKLKSNQHAVQQHHHQQEMHRSLSSITTKITLQNPSDKSTMVAVAQRPESANHSSFSSFEMSSSASSTYSSEEMGDVVSSAPTTPVEEVGSPVFAIDMKAVDQKIGEALATPKPSAVPRPMVEDVVDVEAEQAKETDWQTEEEDNVWGDYDSDETDSDDGSEWETESSGHEAECDTEEEDDCGIVFGDSDDEDVEDEEESEDDGLFGYDSEDDERDDAFGTDEEDEGQLPKLPNIDAHRQNDRPPLRPCLSHADTSQPMKRSESTGSRVRFSETAENPQVIRTRVFLYSYYEFDNMVRSNDCPNEIRSAFADQRTEMERFQELHALREFYISLLDPSEQEKERANPSNAIVGKMEHFLISKLIEEKGEDVLIDEVEKCTQMLMGLVGFGSLKLKDETEKENSKKRNGTVPPTATPTETPSGSDGEWETDTEGEDGDDTEPENSGNFSHPIRI